VNLRTLEEACCEDSPTVMTGDFEELRDRATDSIFFTKGLAMGD
jgi:hypothetical protein